MSKDHTVFKTWLFGRGGSKHPELFKPKRNKILRKNATKEAFRRTNFLPKINFKVNSR